MKLSQFKNLRFQNHNQNLNKTKLSLLLSLFELLQSHNNLLNLKEILKMNHLQDNLIKLLKKSQRIKNHLNLKHI